MGQSNISGRVILIQQGATMTIRVLLALLALMFCSQAKARDWVIYGYGGESCGAWTRVQAHRPRIGADGLAISGDVEVSGQTQWVNGFISAFNVYQSTTPDVGEDIDGNGIFSWIDNYCATHPLDNVSQATLALIDKLSQRAKSE